MYFPKCQGNMEAASKGKMHMRKTHRKIPAKSKLPCNGSLLYIYKLDTAWKVENVQYNVVIKRAWGPDWEILTGKDSLCFNGVVWVEAEVSNIQQQKQKQNEMT